jgi:hypothetical protein
MHKKSGQMMACAVFLAIGLAVAGCERVPPTNVPVTTAIPASFGELVAVTPTDRAYVAVLWFKQPDQTIVAVRVDIAHGSVGPYKTKYPRS